MTTPSRRRRATYPTLVLAAVCSLGVGGAACGPLEAQAPDDPSTPPAKEQRQPIAPATAVDAGTSAPQPNDFFGGGAPYEAYPEDGGVP